MQNDPNKLFPVLRAYHAKAGTEQGGRAKRNVWSVAVYKEEVRQQQATLVDGVFEMMCKRTYRAWAAKPKNGSKDTETADAEWKCLRAKPGALVDERGADPQFKSRVGVRVKDLVTYRDAVLREKIAESREREKRNASQKDFDELEHRLQTESGFKGSGALTPEEMAAVMISSRAASSALGAGDSANTAAAIASALVGKVKELAPAQDQQKLEGEEEAGNEDGEGESNADGASPGKKGQAKPKTPQVKEWFGRDEAVMSQVRKFREYSTKLNSDMRAMRTRCCEVLTDIPTWHKVAVADEAQLLSNRLRAIKLVLSDSTEARLINI